MGKGVRLYDAAAGKRALRALEPAKRRAYVLGGEAAVSKQVWDALVASTVV